MRKCPGTNDEKAGLDEACKGCPNVSYCLSDKKVDPDVSVIRARFSKLEKTIAIMSGKGGVGKSFVSKNLAQTLSKYKNTLLLDFDLTGPSIPRLTKTESNIVYEFDNVIYPIKISDTFSCLSVGHFYLEELSNVNSQIKNDIMKRILKDIDLENIDYVIIDTPPGVSDEHLGIVNYVGVEEAILVTTPQQIAFADVIRQIDFCKKSGIKVVGILENMKKLLCNSCGHLNSILEGGDQVKNYCDLHSIPYLGEIALNQAIAKSLDVGEDYYDSIFDQIVEKYLITC